MLGGGLHDAARHLDRQRRAALHRDRAARPGERAGMDRLRLCARLRPAPGPGRPARRRPWAAQRVHGRSRSVRPGQRRLRRSAVTAVPRPRPGHPGTRRGTRHPTGDRLHPDDVRRRGAGQGVRLLRDRGRHLHGDRSTAGRRPDLCVRNPQRLAGGVLREPAGGRAGAGPGPPLPPGSRAASRGLPSHRTRSGRGGAAGADRDLHPGAVHRAADLAQPIAAVAVRRRRRARGDLGAPRTALRAPP